MARPTMASGRSWLKYTSWFLLLSLEEELRSEFYRPVAHGPGRVTARLRVRIRWAQGSIAPGYREVQVSVFNISIVIELFVRMVQPIESLHAELDGPLLTYLEVLKGRQVAVEIMGPMDVGPDDRACRTGSRNGEARWVEVLAG